MKVCSLLNVFFCGTKCATRYTVDLFTTLPMDLFTTLPGSTSLSPIIKNSKPLPQPALPRFPNFVKLSFKHKDLFKQFTSQYPAYSDWQFSSLQIWCNLNDNLKISTWDGNLIVYFDMPWEGTQHNGYCLIGTNNIDASIRDIFRYLNCQGLPQKLAHVPEFVVDIIKAKEEFDVTEEEDYRDYVLDVSEFSKLAGKRYEKVRGHVNQFTKATKNQVVEFRSLDPGSTATHSDIFNSIRRWEERHPPSNDQERLEHRALRRTLGYALEMGIKGLGMFVDGVLHGFTLYERIGDYYLVHHCRNSYEFHGMQEATLHELARSAEKDGVRFLNLENDLGLEGLRKHKLQLRPSHFLRKFTVVPKLPLASA